MQNQNYTSSATAKVHEIVRSAFINNIFLFLYHFDGVQIDDMYHKSVRDVAFAKKNLRIKVNSFKDFERALDTPCLRVCCFDLFIK